MPRSPEQVRNRQFGARRKSPWLTPVNCASRAVPRGRDVYGRIVSRTAVGFNGQDWRYLCWLARIEGLTMSEVIRRCVRDDRQDTERMFNGDPDCKSGPPWPWDNDDETFY